MKRSAQIGLLVMGALTTTTAAGYFANNQEQACRDRVLNNPQAAAPQDCRRSVWHSWGHSYGGSRPIYAGAVPSGGSAAAATSTPSAGGGSVQRGGFGGFASHIAHAFSGS